MQSESDAIYNARTGRTLAEIMLARGVELPRTAPATVEQIATKAAAAEQVEDVPAVEVGDVPTDAPCSHPACAHANPNTPCHCYHCVGAGHGWIVAQRVQAGRDAFRAKVDRVHGGDVFALFPGGGNPDADLDALFG